MEINTFPYLVKTNFNYLVEEYGFSAKEVYSSNEPYGDGLVEFWSTRTVVSITVDRGDVYIRIGPASESEEARLPLLTIVHYLTRENDPDLEDFIRLPKQKDERVRFCLNKSAELMHKYCDQFLRGNFSGWLDICKFILGHMKEEYRRRTGADYPENDRFVMYVRSKENHRKDRR